MAGAASAGASIEDGEADETGSELGKALLLSTDSEAVGGLCASVPWRTVDVKERWRVGVVEERGIVALGHARQLASLETKARGTDMI